MNVLGKDITKVFEHSTYFLPIWQRRYEWNEPLWKNLWKSILTAYSKGGMSYNDIYFGTMLFQQMLPGEPHYAIIDGQQRLISISLLLSAIRDISVDNPGLTNQINQLILIKPKNFQKEEDNAKLFPSPVDRPRFQNLINGVINKTRESNQIQKCYDFFKDQINFQGQKLDLNHLYEAIASHLCVARVMIDKNERPGEIFYELNYGGLKLKDIDRVRVTFFADLDPALHHIYHDNIWVSIEKKFTETPDMFLDYISTIIGYQGIELGKDPIQDFINQLREFDINERKPQITKFLDDMDSLWDSYLWLACPQKYVQRYCDDIKLRLLRLKIIKISEAIPLLLHWAKLCNLTKNPSSEDKKQFIEILKVVETYYVRNLVCKEGSRIPIEFNKINKNIAPNEDLTLYLDQIKTHLMNSLPHDITFRNELEEAKIYTIKGGAVSRLILFALEHSLDDKNGIIWHPEGHSVEHIMPKTVKDSEWVEYLGPNWETIHSDWCHTLGNLSLVPLSYNSIYSNSMFDDKKISYAEYNYGLFKTINGNEKWRGDEIQKRGSELAKECVEKIWPGFNIPPPPDPDLNPDESKKDIVPPPITIDPPVFEVIKNGDIFKKLFLNKLSQDSPKRWDELFPCMVEQVIKTSEIEFENVYKRNNKLFSPSLKRGFSDKRFLENFGVYIKSSSNEKNIAENCSNLRDLIGWTWENWYGEAERIENGVKRKIYFK